MWITCGSCCSAESALVDLRWCLEPCASNKHLADAMCWLPGTTFRVAAVRTPQPPTAVFMLTLLLQDFAFASWSNWPSIRNSFAICGWVNLGGNSAWSALHGLPLRSNSVAGDCLLYLSVTFDWGLRSEIPINFLGVTLLIQIMHLSCQQILRSACLPYCQLLWRVFQNKSCVHDIAPGPTKCPKNLSRYLIVI